MKKEQIKEQVMKNVLALSKMCAQTSLQMALLLTPLAIANEACTSLLMISARQKY